MLFEPKHILEGNLIQLQKTQATFEIADALYKLIDKNRKHLLPWVGLADTNITSNREEAFLHLIKMIDKWNEQTAFTYLIFENKTFRLIGIIGVNQTQPDHKAVELHFWLGSEYCKKGYMREAVKLIEKEFFFLEFERITIKSDVENYATRNLAVKSGYRLEGTLRHSGWCNQFRMYRDYNIFAKLKAEQ